MTLIASFTVAIHPTAIVDKSAEVDSTVEIGAYAVVEANVRIGAGTRVYPHAYVSGNTTIGERVQIHPFAMVGHLPQDLKFDGSPTYTRVGDGCIIREHASIHRGTVPGSTTTVGRRVFLMSTAHIGHNCQVGDDVVMVTGAMLAGHVSVGNRAIIGGNTAAHQFVRVGELVMISGMMRVRMDVPPFMLADEHGVVATNSIGLRRAGFSFEERDEVRKCFRTLYRSGSPFREAVQSVVEMVRTAPGKRLAEFLCAASKRGLMGSAHRRLAAANEDSESGVE